MRIGFVRVHQRTNSFAKVTTEFGDFVSSENMNGQHFVDRYAESSTFAGGLIRGVGASGHSLGPILSISARSGGPVSDECAERLAKHVVDALSADTESIDALVVELSGAMSTVSGISGDEIMINSARGALPGVPVLASLSAQANVTPTFASACDWILAPESVPDIDSPARGRCAVEVLERLVDRGNRPAPIILEQLPLLIPVPAQRSGQQPIDGIRASVHRFNAEHPEQTIAFFCGYPYSDTDFAGASIVANAFSPTADLVSVVASLRAQVMETRAQFYVQGMNVEEAVHEAMARRDGPVLITDLGDNPSDGAPGDGTTTLWALLDLGVRNATVAAIADEQAVAACVRAGVGAKVEIPVGGRRDTRHGYPIDIRGRIVSVHNGPVRLNGPIGGNDVIEPGTVVVIDVEARHEGHVELILTERPVEITDTALFKHAGIEVADRKILSIKSAVDYRPAFEGFVSGIYEVITPGVTTPDPEFFQYQRIRRPIYPLDQVQEPAPQSPTRD